MDNVWIIGGTTGIGAAVAHELGMSELYDVTMTDEHTTNVVNYKELEEFMNFKEWHHIVYSAGINELAWLENLTEVTMMKIMDVNVLGFMRLMRVVARNKKSKPNSVTAIVSDAATHPMRTSMVYCASKAALAMAVRCAARELAPYIRVNGVSPGVVMGTPLTSRTDQQIEQVRGWTTAEAEKYELAGMPMHRRAYPREISQVVKNVLEGPAYLTGSIIEVNGAR